MINSMTAFARTQAVGAWGSAVCEIRSVNHRYQDIRVHLPDNLFALEQPIYDYLRETIKRGKVECYIRFQPGEGLQPALEINLPLVKKLSAVAGQVAQELKINQPLNPIDILRWPGIVQVHETNVEIAHQEILQLTKNAVKALIEVRTREGKDLKQLSLQRLDTISEELAKVKSRLPGIMQHQRERLLKRFKDAAVELDAHRLEQEMVVYAQKIDVDEELDRLDTHIAEVRRVLDQGGLTGRRLDFLMQELNREANTLGSKSVDVETTHAALEMKVLIEQLREQMQNLE